MANPDGVLERRSVTEVTSPSLFYYTTGICIKLRSSASMLTSASGLDRLYLAVGLDATFI